MNYYKVLGVNENADSDEIKSAYRKLAKVMHPDSGGDSEKFQQLSEAYDVLKDPVKRKQYDMQMRTRSGTSAFSDIFSDLNQSGFTWTVRTKRRSAQTKNKDLNVEVSITLAESLEDTEKIISVRHLTGDRKFVTITIPAGTIEGFLKYSGLGDSSIQGLPPGDLHVKVRVNDFQGFDHDGIDLKKHITISVYQAILGGTVTMNSPWGKKLNVTIPPGTQHGTVLNVPGHGLPKFKDPNTIGRLLLTVLIKIPENLTDEQLKMVRRLSEIDNEI